VYDATVVTATMATVPTVAATLALQGYIITAMGGNADQGLLSVGMRVRGDTLARPIQVEAPSGNQGQIDSSVAYVYPDLGSVGADFYTNIGEQ